MRFMTVAVLISLLFASSALATPDEYANIHTVAIVSAFGGKMNLQTVGVTVFGNSSNQLDLSGTIDTTVTARIASMISGRFSIKPSPLDASFFETMTEEDRVPNALQAKILARPDPDIDAYIVVVTGHQTFMGQTNDGLGLMHSTGLFGKSDNLFYANYAVVVIDAKDSHIIAWSHGRSNDGNPHTGFVIAICDKSIWPEQPSAAISSIDAFRTELNALVLDGLPHALSSVGLLTNAAPQSDPVPDIPQCHLYRS